MTNFNQLSLTYQLDIVEEYLVMAMDDVAHGTHYSKLSDIQKVEVKDSFEDYLSEAKISITPELVQLAKDSFNNSPLPSLMQEYDTNHSVFAETVSNVKLNNKVTIIKYTDFGFPYAINTVIDSLVIKPYAQHKDSLFITHKPKGRRKLWEEVILPYQSFIIYDGWLNVDIDSLTKKVISSNSQLTVTTTNYVSFDKRYMTDIVSSIPQTPLVSYNVKEAVTYVKDAQ
ncbi:hypothetical protein [Paenibacillus odorifer]|uniref:hypothetical protein n=1 Tax=Paenibacillus odorifer TaxID=189426 RepID=UPI00096F20DE|nr:hypothetical protein [Paenibacillus odorifer]OMD67629.1 hypothetical protein BSK50_30125 [Paenibacillus odorifer]